MAKKTAESNEGCFTAIAVLLIVGGIIQFWQVVVAILAVVLVTWGIVTAATSIKNARQRQREQEAADAQQHRLDTLGRRAIARIDAAAAAAERVGASEAAQSGWLGDVDFSGDLAGITDSFARAHALRQKATDLGALPRPNDDDRRLLADANAAARTLETNADRRVDLISRCAAEADLIDQSLQQERDDAVTDAQRAELHGELHGMLYGADASPPVTGGDSAADRVIARVAGYREVKEQIEAARHQGFD